MIKRVKSKKSKRAVEARARDAVNLLVELDDGELGDKLVLIVGRGDLGKAVRKRLRALGAQTHYYDAKAPNDLAGSVGLVTTIRGGMISANCHCAHFSDYIVLAGPLNEENEGTMGNNFRPCRLRLKVLVSASDPGLITEEELKRVLGSKKKAERVIVACFKDNAWDYDWLDKPVKDGRLIIK